MSSNQKTNNRAKNQPYYFYKFSEHILFIDTNDNRIKQRGNNLIHCLMLESLQNCI